MGISCKPFNGTNDTLVSFMLGHICTVSNGRVNVSNSIRVFLDHTSSYAHDNFFQGTLETV